MEVENKLKIVTVIGARPQFIKAAMVSRELQATHGIEEVVVHTGQHYDENLSKVFFSELTIRPPDYNLGVGSDRHGAQTGRMLMKIEEVLLETFPDWILVYGDTNSTLAGALAAVKLHMSVAHVEAGLRSFNRRMPEEINRILTDHASDILFAPTETAVANLRSEGIPKRRIIRTGDVMYDAALHYSGEIDEDMILNSLGLKAKDYVLATVHRAENTDNITNLRNIVNGLKIVAQQVSVLLPLHPRTRNALNAAGLLDQAEEQLSFIEPVGYLDMIALERQALSIATDSGGIQKEAYFHKIPCVTLRGETEWVELVETGWNVLCPPRSPDAISTAILESFGSQGKPIDLYGDGHSAERIVESLRDLQ
jgi:UDP-GlcNAc3NAcA epimerase